MYTHATKENDQGVFEIMLDGDVIADVMSLGNAESIVGYLNAGGCALRTERDRHEESGNVHFILNESDDVVARTTDYIDAEILIGHANR